METSKFIKRLAKGATIATIGVLSILPNESKGQTIEKDVSLDKKKDKMENQIEISDQLNQQILKEVEKGFQNGILENSPTGPYYYSKESGKYKISFNLDVNQDGQKEEDPQIRISYKEGNSSFSLVKEPKIAQIKDLVINYEDESLTDAETDTYENFFAKNNIVILNLYGDKTHPVHFRKISNTEKKQILFDLKTIMGKENTITAQKNIENIKNFENQKEIEHRKEILKSEIESSAKKLLDILKKTGVNVSQDGLYKYTFGYKFEVSFVDKNGNQNEIKFYTNPQLYLGEARKIIMKNGKPKSIQDFSLSEVKNIVDDALSKIDK